MNPYGRKTRHEIIQRQLAKPGLRGAINAKCTECVYDPGAPGSWRQQVSACGSTQCPLYHVRPQPLPVPIHGQSEPA